MSKKLLSVVLALCLAVSCFALGASAIGGYAYEAEEDVANYAQTWALDEPVDNGDGTYSVNVRLTANYKVGPIQFKLVKNVTAGSLSIKSVTANKSVIPANWLAQVSFSNVSNKIAIIPMPTDEVDGIDLTAGKIIATIVFNASADVAATVAINTADAKTETNPAGTLIAARMSDGNVVTGTAICGQTINATNTITFGSAAQAPELVAIDGTLGVVDTSRTMLDELDIDGDGDMQEIDGYLLGYDPDMNMSLEELFEIEGDGEMEIIVTEEALANGLEASTGTMVNVLDLEGNVVATYVAIIFGDVNCDGIADGYDSGYIDEHDAWMLGDWGRLFSYQEFAGDVDVSGFCDGYDSGYIGEHDAWMLGDLGRIDVAGIIATLGF
ncbi:MAG: hypothetical protein IIX14_07795 [Clostridia bacterium]|nr:hypothetical protein [Clostridia bacterium]